MKEDLVLNFLKNFFWVYNSKDLLIEFRLIKDHSITQLFIEYSELDEHIEEVLHLAETHNCYFGILPRCERKGTKDAIKTGKYAWTDIDFHNIDLKEAKEVLETKYKELRNKLQEAHLPLPNVVVYSGKGLQVYWLLENELSIEEIEKLNKAIVVRLNELGIPADKQACDASRLFRLPFTFNFKYEKPIEAELWEFRLYPNPINAFTPETIETKEVKKIKLEEFNGTLPYNKRKALANFFSLFWIKNYRNKLNLALIGYLMKNDVCFEHTYEIVKQTCILANDEEIKKRLYDVEYHYSQRIQVKELEELVGFSGFIETVKEMIEKDYTALVEHIKQMFPRLLAQAKGRTGSGITAFVEEFIEILEEFPKGGVLFDDIEAVLRRYFKRIDIKQKEELIKVYTASKLKEVEEKKKFLIKDLLPAGSVVIIGGPPGVGKSLLTLYLSYSISLGKKAFEKFETEKTRVYYIDLETGPIVFKSRIASLFGDTISDSFFYVEVYSLEELKKEIQKLPDGSFLVIDSLRRFLSGDENKSATINAFYLNVLKPLRSRGITVWLVHHIRKPSKEEDSIDEIFRFRGSSDITAVVDQAFLLEKQEECAIEGGGIRKILLLKELKNRLGPQHEPLTIQIDTWFDQNKTEIKLLETRYQYTTQDIVKEAILSVLKEKELLRRKELIELTKERIERERGLKIGRDDIEEALRSLLSVKKVIKVKRGVYTIPKIKLENEQGKAESKKRESAGKKKFEFLSNPVFGPCSYCGRERDLPFKDEEGNYVCEECAEDESE